MKVLWSVSVLACVLATAAQAQEEAASPPEPASPAAEATPAEAAPVAPPADSARAGTLATIPVDADDHGSAPPAGRTAHPYSWGAARLTQTEYNEGGGATTTAGITGSYLLLPNAYGVAALLLGEADDPASGETTQFELGAGYRAGLTPSTDLNATIRYIWVETDTPSGAASDEIGLGFDGTVRTMLTDRIEASAGLTYSRVFKAGHAFATGSAFYALIPQFSLGIEALVGNSGYSYGLLGRWAF